MWFIRVMRVRKRVAWVGPRVCGRDMWVIGSSRGVIETKREYFAPLREQRPKSPVWGGVHMAQFTVTKVWEAA